MPICHDDLHDTHWIRLRAVPWELAEQSPHPKPVQVIKTHACTANKPYS